MAETDRIEKIIRIWMILKNPLMIQQYLKEINVSFVCT